MFLLLLFAFLAGIATVLSPCILPVLPALLSATATGGKGRPLGVILGLVASFVFFTLALTTLVQSFGISANVLRYTAILLIGFFGLVLILPTFSDLFARLTSVIASAGANVQSYQTKRQGFWSGLLIGSALGLVWTPCAGPILAAITTLVATQHVTTQVILLTIAYSLGAGLPLLLIAYGGQRALTSFPSLVRHTELIRQIFGGLMILTALALAFNWDSAFQQQVLDYFPSIQIENNAWVQKKLEGLREPSPGFPNQDNNPFAAPIENVQAGDPQAKLPLIAPAPSLEGATAWLNSPPLDWQQLKGKVVLIDFWTYSCINCLRTLPYLRRWYDTYKDQSFTIIGVHTPEFEFEKDKGNVEKAVKRLDVTYPVALDNHYTIWQAFHNSYWPAHYLVDQNGIVRQVHFGEGNYQETEEAIRSLLNLKPLQAEAEKENKEPVVSAKGITPETYLGYARAKSYNSQNAIKKDQVAPYRYLGTLDPNAVGLTGSWLIAAENITSESEDATLSLDFKANRVYLVLGGASMQPIYVDLDGAPLTQSFFTTDMDSEGNIFVKEPRKYDIVNLRGKEEKRHVLTLHIPKGIQAYAFTFGMEE